MQSIYQEIILDHYQHPRNYGSLKRADVITHENNPFCGDNIVMAATIKNQRLKTVKFSGVGCAISIASASLLTSYAKGKTKEQLLKLDKNFIIRMLGIELGINRLKCALLPLQALQQLLIKFEYDRSKTIGSKKSVRTGKSPKTHCQG